MANNNNNEQQPQDKLSRIAKQQAKKQIAKKVGKAISKAVSTVFSWLFKYLVVPILPYFLVFLFIVFLVFFAWHLVLNNRGKTQDYQSEDIYEYNSVEKQDETGDIVASDLSFGNKIVKAFYTYFAEKSIYITCPDTGVNEPIQYNSPDFIAKFGENGETSGFKDKYGREKMFYISPNALWSLDEFLNKGQFKFPEQFIKPVYNSGIEGNYELKQLTDENGELVAESQKYVDSLDKQSLVPKEGEKTKGVWDYGFGSILNYKKFEEQAKKVGAYEKIEVWDVEQQKTVQVELEEAKKGFESGKYEGYQDYIDMTYEADMPEANKVSFMIDKVTSPAGTIFNQIEQTWEDSGEPFTTTQTRNASVTVKYEEQVTKQVFLKCNESITVNTYIDINGKESKPITLSNPCDEEDHSTHTGKFVSYTVTQEKTRKENKQLSVTINGTIHRYIPRYIGTPDTSKITGSQYYRDYIRYYTTYAPETVLTTFNFDEIRKRTGKDEEELLQLLERESFGGGQTSTANIDMSNFKLGEGASSSNFKNAMQHFNLFEKYGNMYGVDPYLLVAIASQESSGRHDKYISQSRCASAGCGIMQIEQPGKTITQAVAFNQETKKTDVVTVTYSNAVDLEQNIKIGAMLQSARMKAQQYNILIGLQSYNYGPSAFNKALQAYCNEVGKTRDQVISDVSDIGWLKYVKDLHDNPQKYIPSWRGSTYGDDEYISHVLRYYASPYPEGIWVQKEDGSKVTLNANGLFSTGSSSSNSGGVSSNWLSNIWNKVKDGWKSLFGDLPETLPVERTKFENKVPETDIDTIIKMMFVMEEQKYLTEYDDWTDDTWKEKFKLLFSNPIGNAWGDNIVHNVNLNEYFPNGFDLPLNLSNLTIKTPYSINHMGIDIISPKGTSVKAIADGVILEIGENPNKGGKYIVIQHEGGVNTLYGNVESTSLKVSDKVTKGQSIGLTGSGSEGDVLHFELSKNGKNEDPSWIVSGFFNASDYDMSEEDAQIINQVISLAKQKIGLPYMWGAKGEIMTSSNMRALFNTYGRSKYPLSDSAYLGKQAFDCSGFTKWLYKEVTGVSIGDGTTGQKSTLKNYKVPMNQLQPGDIIFGPGHVTLYIGNGQIIHASNSKAYPQGGVKQDKVLKSTNEAYRPIAYIRDVLNKK